MTQDTEDVVARMTRFAETLSVNRHYMTGQTCMEVQEATRALLADRQSLSDRIDELESVVEKCREKFDFYEQLHRLKCTAEGDEKADRNREMADLCSAALHQEGIAP